MNLVQMLMSNEVGALLTGALMGTVTYHLSKHWVNLLMMFIRSENSRKAYWLCLSNEHHGYLKPSELTLLKEESELNVRDNLAQATATLILWLFASIVVVCL